jgi:hypothetical protein
LKFSRTISGTPAERSSSASLSERIMRCGRGHV